MKKVGSASKAKKKPKLSIEGKRAREAKHELFCLEYVKDQNATRAARDVGYSPGSASVIGVRLLAKDRIKARVKKLLEERAARVLLSGDEILLGIKALATSDVRRLFDTETGCFLPMDQWPDDMAVCVASIEIEELFRGSGKNRIWVGYTKKLKLWDKPKSQENLGRNKGLFKDVVESTVEATVVTVDESQVKAAIEKAEREV